MEAQKTQLLIKLLNIIDLVGICIVLLVALVLQLLLHELPCPLCLLQRLGILAIGFGFLLNVRYKIRPKHYGLVLLAAILTGIIAVRQMFLHIVPGTGAYGEAFLGLHLYTWVAIFSLIVIIYTSVILSLPEQYCTLRHEMTAEEQKLSQLDKCLGHLAFILFLTTIILNIVFGFLQCGFQRCPEDPTDYKLLRAVSQNNNDASADTLKMIS